MKNPLKIIKEMTQGKPKEDTLAEKRHTLAHLLAAAVLKHYPDAKPTIGPAIDNGFYYDFEFSTPVSDKDLQKIEQSMKEILKTWDSMEGREISLEDAHKIFSDNQFKLELIDEIVKDGQKITLYKAGEFEDLCRGGHSESPSKEIRSDSFKLDRVAGAYWRGDESREMLTRIYGLAFNTKDELKGYLEMRKEAEKRDHRKLGKELDLFIFSDLVGSGLPLWTPRGTLVRNLLDEKIWEMRKAHGYEKVEIPHITKKDLYEKSGHWSKFADELFHIKTREGHEFVMKPMNCPHHTQIYARKNWSYRQLPQRYANTTMCYRDEQSGELSGLSRVRSFTQDDAHVFCRYSHIKSEFIKVIDIIERFYGSFGLELHPRLSLHDPKEMQKYLGEEKLWIQMENELRSILKEKKQDFFEASGEAAFYGPKIDFMAKDALGREHQVATVQLDMNQPEGFDLTCVNEKGENERIVMIHAAIMGSIDRFLSILIEHTAGNLPLWLSPEQVRIMPITDTHKKFAGEVFKNLQDVGYRVALDDSSETLGKKIRSVKLDRVPYFLVIGDEEMKNEVVMVESRDNGKIGVMKIEKLLDHLKKESIS